MTRGQTAPRRVTTGLRQRAWWVLRNRQECTLPQLLATLTDGTEKDAASNLGKYLNALCQAGIIKPAAHRAPGTAPTSHGHLRYLLIQDCGRAAPVWRTKSKTVYAPDLDTVYSLEVRHG